MFLSNVVVNKYIRDVKPPHIYSHFRNYSGEGGALVLGGLCPRGAFVRGGVCPRGICPGGQVSGGASVRIPLSDTRITLLYCFALMSQFSLFHTGACNISYPTVSVESDVSC